MMLRRTDISTILILAGAATACARPEASDEAALASSRSQLLDIADTCGLPARALSLSERGEVRFRPSPDTRYEVVDCTLAQLRERGLAEHMPMAFVGNESLAEEKGNHASPY